MLGLPRKRVVTTGEEKVILISVHMVRLYNRRFATVPERVTKSPITVTMLARASHSEIAESTSDHEVVFIVPYSALVSAMSRMTSCPMQTVCGLDLFLG